MANIFKKLASSIDKAANNFGRALDNFKPLQSIGNGITGFVKGSVKSIPGAATGALAGIGGGVPGIVAGAIAGGAPTVIKETVAGVSGGDGGGSAVPSVLNGIAGIVGDVMSSQGGKVGEVGKIISSASDVVADSLLPKDNGSPSVSGGVTVDLPGGGSVTINGKTGPGTSGSSGGSSGGSSSSSGGWKGRYNLVTDELSASVPIVYPFQRKG